MAKKANSRPRKVKILTPKERGLIQDEEAEVNLLSGEEEDKPPVAEPTDEIWREPGKVGAVSTYCIKCLKQDDCPICRIAAVALCEKREFTQQKRRAQHA